MALADVFAQLQLPLHGGHALGLPGRSLMSFMGLMVAMLSFTGVVIWVRKRRREVQVRIANILRRSNAEPTLHG